MACLLCTPPSSTCVGSLPFSNVAEALEFARGKPIRRVQPELSRADDQVRVWLAPELIDAW